MKSASSTADFACREREFRRRAFPAATAADWADWRWQLRHRARTAAAVARALDLSPRECRALAAPEATTFATNSLTLIVPPGNPAGVTGLDDSLDGAKVVVCQPRVPCGL